MNKMLIICDKCKRSFKKVSEFVYAPDCDCYDKEFKVSVG
jgi:hypothetical protein